MNPGAKVRARTSGQGDEQIVCSHCGKRSPPGPTCQKCGKLLQETKDEPPHSFRIDGSTNRLADEMAELWFVKKNKGAALKLALHLLKRASNDDPNDELARDLRRGVSEVGSSLFHKKADLEFAFFHAFPTTKRGPKPQADDGKSDK